MTGQRFDAESTEQAVRDWLAGSAPRRAPASLRATLDDVTARPTARATSMPRVGGHGFLVAGRLAATMAILAIAAASIYVYNSGRPGAAGSDASSSPSAASTTASGSAAPSISPDLSQAPNVTLPANTSWQAVRGAFPRLARSGDIGNKLVFALPRGGFVAFVPTERTLGRRPAGDAAMAPAPAEATDAMSWVTQVFTSSDGISWSNRSTLPGDASLVRAVTEYGGRILAVGQTSDPLNSMAAAWTSTDLGSWQATVLPAASFAMAEGVAAGPAGLVAWGYDGAETVLWASSDGIAWRSLAPTGLPQDFGGELFGLPDGYALRGFLSDRAVIWRSTDGQRWTQAWTGPAMSGGESYLLGPILRAAGGGYISFGLVASGGPLAEPSDLLVWTSSDSVHWTMSDRVKSPGWITTCAALPGGYVAAGWSVLDVMDTAYSPLGVWTSPDGRTWTSLPGAFSIGRVKVGYVVSDEAHAVVPFTDKQGNIGLLVGGGLR